MKPTVLVARSAQVTVVSIDKAGRIIIPKETRTAQGMRPGTKFLLVEGRDGRLWLQRLDPKELADRIEQELKGIDLRPIISKVEKEIEHLAAETCPVLARR